MTTQLQCEFTETSPYRTEEVNHDQFWELANRQSRGEIRLLTMQAPRLKDRWTWKVTYKILEGANG